MEMGREQQGKLITGGHKDSQSGNQGQGREGGDDKKSRWHGDITAYEGTT